ncbi:low temperature requirement protein A [Humitalea sp. 24SJ18S-53]|uniref:low temperature requirement protein A n=1 Tax=Humitalea sp. 24SJ18S-53 TaxID=3422307 RepID=UPI003D668370
MQTTRSDGLLRPHATHGHHRVTYVELFFDLIFVFAITELSHALLHHPSPGGVLQGAMLLLGVWWVWVNTSWATNWLDPERVPVRLMLFAMMAVGLLMATAIPKAFDTRGLAFAGAFVLLQLGRTVFVLAAIPAGDRALRRNFQRILCWFTLAAPFWIAGGIMEGTARPLLWGVALAIEYASPAMRFWVPGLGASSVDDWSVEGGHMAERCGLFIIIALGESVLITGATFADAAWTWGSGAGLAAAFAGSIAMWWIYFDTGAEAGVARITGADAPGRVARLAYTYLHLPIVAGIILTAAGDELVLAHPGGDTGAFGMLTMIGGPLLFLTGVILFKASIRGWFQVSHMVGMVALLALGLATPWLAPLAVSMAVTGILVVVAMWETWSLGAAE